MAIFSALSGAIGGGMAADAIRAGNREAAQTQREMYRTNLRLLSPQYTIGQSAMFQLADLYGLDRPAGYTDVEDIIGQYGRGRDFGELMALGLGGLTGHDMGSGSMGGFAGGFRGGGPGGEPGRVGLATAPADERRAAAMDKFYTSPDYTFRLDEGLKALDRSAAARGQMLSGAHLKDMTRFSQGLASSEYGNYVNRLAALAGYNQVAAGQATGLGANMANNVSQLQASSGQARASGYLTAVQGLQSGVQNTLDAAASGLIPGIG